DEFARLAVREKASLLQRVLPRIVDVAPEWVAAGCRAKDIPLNGPLSGEEWLGGPTITARNVRLLIQSLLPIAETGKPPLGRGARVRSDGRLEINVFPASGLDGALFSGFSVRALMQEGVTESRARAMQASFYSNLEPPGRVTCVLGAGNVSSIPPT